MLLEILQTLVVGALVSFVVQVTLTLLHNWRAQRFFDIHSPSLPKVPNLSLFSGQAFSVAYGGRNWLKLHEYHLKLGPNICAFIRDVPAVSTIDLNLIKQMVIDAPHDHENRMGLMLLVQELEEDCIAFAEDDQWRRIRRAVGPAFA